MSRPARKKKSPFPVSVALTLLASSHLSAAAAETNSAPSMADAVAAAEKKACSENLLKIFEAIQAFEKDKKEIPDWLSDLVPKYVSDPNLLVCPTARRTGRTEGSPLADPNLPSSYLFEFCPVPLGNMAPATPDQTRREWKRRQMGLLGSVVPIVRCRNHTQPLNLSFDGKLYDSPPAWESAFSDRVPFDKLSPTNLFPAGTADAAQPAINKPPAAERFPARDKKAKRAQLDLTQFYNVAFGESLQGKDAVSLKAIPTGVQTIDDTQFDVRGIVQLAAKNLRDPKCPAQVRAIPAKQKCRRLHFLHATTLAGPGDWGTQVASYIVRFSRNSARLEIPIFYGKDIANVQPLADEKNQEPKPAWTGTAPAEAATPAQGALRLYKFTWENIAPETEIESIDLVSALGNAAPLVIAITAE